MPRFRSEAKKLSCWRTRIEGLSQSLKMRQWADGSVFSDSCSWGYLLEKAERKMPAEHATEFASACTHSHHVAMPCNAKQAGCWWEVFSAHYVVFPNFPWVYHRHLLRPLVKKRISNWSEAIVGQNFQNWKQLEPQGSEVNLCRIKWNDDGTNHFLSHDFSFLPGTTIRTLYIAEFVLHHHACV